MTDFERATEAKASADKALNDALDAITADYVAAKSVYVADPTHENFLARRVAGRALSNARQAYRANPPEVPSGDFRGSDAEAFLPEDQGGDTARALELLEGLFASRGDTTSVPTDVLVEMRAQVISTREGPS